MGCRCCKMIQSYLLDPVQVASPGCVNEVNSCKVDEAGPGKARGKRSCEAPVHKEEPSEAPRGAGSALNGVGPASAPQRGPRAQGSVRRARPEPRVAGAADPGAGGPAAEEPEPAPAPAPAPRLPPPDYPAPQGCAGRPGGAGRGHPPAGGRGLRTPEPPGASRDAPSEPAATDVRRLYLQDAGPAPGAAPGAAPAAGSTGRWEDAPEDAAVAEALAALEAATAGEDVDEAD